MATSEPWNTTHAALTWHQANVTVSSAEEKSWRPQMQRRSRGGYSYDMTAGNTGHGLYLQKTEKIVRQYDKCVDRAENCVEKQRDRTTVKFMVIISVHSLLKFNNISKIHYIVKLLQLKH